MQNQMILGLIVGIFLLIILVLKTKIHAFLALIISAAVTGLVGGMPQNEVLASISKGFGGTLGSIGIIIGFGVMMGEIFEISGAAKRMAKTFITLFGKGREEIALAITGFIVSIPIFCDSGFVVLSPLVKAISKATKKSVISLGISLGLGLVITHSLVPPTPGPVGVAGIFGIGVGTLMMWGIIIGIPMTLGGIVYAKYIGKVYYQLPHESEEGYVRLNEEEIQLLTAEGNSEKDMSDTSNIMHMSGGLGSTSLKIDILESAEFSEDVLPSAFASFAPIFVPIIFIFIGTIINFMKLDGGIIPAFKFLGNPVIAVGIGLIISIYSLANKHSKEVVTDAMERGIKSCGIIILVTGGGGALGTILRDSGAGNQVAQIISELNIPGILVPLIVSTIIRAIQGSGTVAMLTAASITAPMIASLNVNPVFAALGACIGSLFFGCFNDSYFWVVNRTLGIKETKEQIRVWSITSTICWFIGVVTLLILNFVFG